MFFNYNLLLSEENFNSILHSLKFNQTIFDDENKKEAIKLMNYFMGKSKIIKQNDINMITICLSDLKIQELMLQLTATNTHFISREQLDWISNYNYFEQLIEERRIINE